MEDNKRKKVLCPVERKNGKTFWMHVGSAFENRDGSVNVYLDALPSNNRLQIREQDERDFERKRERSGEAVNDELPF